MVRFRGSEVLTDTEIADLGKNYTGVSGAGGVLNPVTGSVGSLRYGFVLLTEDQPIVTRTSHSVTLKLPPQSIVQDEPAATNITYTQNSGRFIERRGQLSKTITIQGTTGFNANPALPYQVRLGLPTAVIMETEGPVSGMAEFIKLRNLFRRYWEVFSDDANGPSAKDKTKMIFVNEKDDEQWIVEPMVFRMVRQVPRNKFTYNYEITLQTVARVEDVLLIEDPITLFKKLANVRQIMRTIANDLTRMSTLVGRGMAQVSGVMKEATDAVTNTIDNIASGAALIADGTKDIFETPEVIRGRVATTGNVVAGASEKNMATAVEAFLNTRDSINNLDGEDPVPVGSVSAGEMSVDAALTEAQNIVGRLSGRSELFNKTMPANWDEQVLKYYDPSFGFGGYNRKLTDPLARPGVREGTILPGDDIITVAMRELGDAERYQEIIVLNNLKPPYISASAETRSPNTLAPHDPILLPDQSALTPARSPVRTTVFTDPTFTGVVTTGGATTSTVDVPNDWRANQWQGFTVEIVEGTGVGQKRKVDANTADSISVDKVWATVPDATSIIRIYLVRIGRESPKSAYEQQMGVDLKLKNNDLVLSASGDFDLISGTNNLLQAINTKFKTRPGELTIHLNFGLASEPGVRALPENIISHKVAVKQLLLSDPRIEAVERLTVQADGDTLRTEGYAVTASGVQPFAVDTQGGG